MCQPQSTGENDINVHSWVSFTFTFNRTIVESIKIIEKYSLSHFSCKKLCNKKDKVHQTGCYCHPVGVLFHIMTSCCTLSLTSYRPVSSLVSVQNSCKLRYSSASLTSTGQAFYTWSYYITRGALQWHTCNTTKHNNQAHGPKYTRKEKITRHSWKWWSEDKQEIKSRKLQVESFQNKVKTEQ